MLQALLKQQLLEPQAAFPVLPQEWEEHFEELFHPYDMQRVSPRKVVHLRVWELFGLKGRSN